MRLASAEAKSSENDCPRPCVCRVVLFPTAHPPTPPSFLSLYAPKMWGPMGVSGSRSKPALLSPCQWSCSWQSPAPPLVGSFGRTVPSSLSCSAGTGWGFTVVTVQLTGVSGGAGARSGFSVPRLSPSMRLLWFAAPQGWSLNATCGISSLGRKLLIPKLSVSMALCSSFQL